MVKTKASRRLVIGYGTGGNLTRTGLNQLSNMRYANTTSGWLRLVTATWVDPYVPRLNASRFDDAVSAATVRFSRCNCMQLQWGYDGSA